MRIHAIDIVQPPGMAIPPAIDWHIRTVPATLAAKSKAESAKNPPLRASRAVFEATAISAGGPIRFDAS